MLRPSLSALDAELSISHVQRTDRSPNAEEDVSGHGLLLRIGAEFMGPRASNSELGVILDEGKSDSFVIDGTGRRRLTHSHSDSQRRQDEPSPMRRYYGTPSPNSAESKENVFLAALTRRRRRRCHRAAA